MTVLPGLVLCLSVLVAIVSCDTYPECDDASKTGSFVSSPQGCAYYIYCDGTNSFEDSCPTNLMFNVIDAVCDDAENVDCVDTSVSTTLQTIIPTTSTSTTTPIITSSPPTSGVTSTTTPASTLSPTSGPDGQIVCPQPSTPDEVIYLPNPDSCTDYYMCYRLTAIPMSCPNDLQFNSLKGSCDWAETANCRIVGTTTISPREVCSGQYSGYFAYPSNCQYYYRCTSGMLTIQECPIGFGWDVTRKMCTATGCAN